MKTILYVLVAALLAGCSSATSITSAQRAALERAASLPQIVFTAQWAVPLDQTSVQVLNALQPAGGVVNGNRVQIESGGHYLKLTETTIDVNLPYYGTRQISGGLPGNTGIVVEKGSYTKKDGTGNKDGQHNIQVQTSSKGESYTIALRLFAQGKAIMVVNSSQRQSIRYTGTWK